MIFDIIIFLLALINFHKVLEKEIKTDVYSKNM